MSAMVMHKICLQRVSTFLLLICKVIENARTITPPWSHPQPLLLRSSHRDLPHRRPDLPYPHLLPLPLALDCLDRPRQEASADLLPIYLLVVFRQVPRALETRPMSALSQIWREDEIR